MLVIDSGFGGLTVLDAIKAANAVSQPCYYIADSGYGPYGARDEQYIISRYNSIIEIAYKMFDIKTVVIACHTLSCVLFKANNFKRSKVKEGKSIFMMYTAVIAALDNIPKNSKVLFLCTVATANTQVIQYIIKSQRSDIKTQIYCIGDTIRVLEMMGLKHENYVEALSEYFFAQKNCDVVIYGCTHFPLIRDYIETIFGPHYLFIDPAHYVAPFLPLNSKGYYPIQYYTTGDVKVVNERVKSLEPMLKSLESIEFQHINIPLI